MYWSSPRPLNKQFIPSIQHPASKHSGVFALTQTCPLSQHLQNLYGPWGAFCTVGGAVVKMCMTSSQYVWLSCHFALFVPCGPILIPLLFSRRLQWKGHNADSLMMQVLSVRENLKCRENVSQLSVNMGGGQQEVIWMLHKALLNKRADVFLYSV